MMAAPKSRPAAQEQAAPPYYIALVPLFLDDQFSRAHNPGDRVPAEHVERFGWADKVRLPGEASPSTPDQPETEPGQATSKDGA